MLYETPHFLLMGDRALLVEIGDVINPEVNRKVRELFLILEENKVPGIRDLVPSYRSLMVVYDPLELTLATLQDAIAHLWKHTDASRLPRPKVLEVPVLYGGKYGPDLEWVASYHQLSPEEVIGYHTLPTYQVYMIGFTPGYPYLGEVPEAIATPRRQTPRTLVPQGSVAIAHRQTGIYPVQSPGGWHILGWTPLKLFDAAKWPPSLLEMGDMVKFIQIKEEKIPEWKG
jgi:KipI family sensor histidine kinase inhibitor